MSDIFQQLLSSQPNNAPSAELLETLGSQAARKFVSGDSQSLNDLIAQIASEHSNLGNEHIKRIAEFANNQVFQTLHSKEEDKNVHFDVADPGVIIRDLRDGGSPSHDGKTLNTGMADKDKVSVGDNITDYGTPPSGGFGDLDSGMNELFRQDEFSGVNGTGEPVAKTASVHTDHSGHANPVEDVYDMHVQLKAAREKVAEAHEQFDLILKQARADFYEQAKNIVLDPDGPGLPGVVEAIKLAAPSEVMAYQVLRPVAEQLSQEQLVLPEDMHKRASAKVVNDQHPLVQTFCGLVKAATEKLRAEKSLEEIDSSLKQTEGFLQDHLR